MSKVLKGQCLCGAVQFQTGEIDHLDICHCHMCQRWTGGPFMGADFRNGSVEILQGETLKWYESSEWAKRGFCSECGSSLFYRLKDNDDFWAVCAGALELPEEIRVSKEIFVDEKPKFYDFAGDAQRLTGAEFLAGLAGTDPSAAGE